MFGVKGGAAGGGYAQVVPMEDINLHFTGDLHAIGTANNLLAAMIDNSIQQGNPLNIDPRRITWKRCMDMNDRQLRFIVDGLGGKVNGTPREDGFDITVASEVMAIFCLATSISDLKERLAKIVCAYTYDGKPVTAGEIGAAGAMTALLKDALDPNLVQTLENNPDTWMDAADLAREFGMDYQTMLSRMSNSMIKVEPEDRGDMIVAYVCDILRSGTAPIDYCSSSIRDIIISTRKHELVKGLEQDLLDNALESKQFVIY